MAHDTNGPVPRHPLTWPAGWPRTPAGARMRGGFRSSKTDVIADLTGSQTVRREVAVSVFVATQRLDDQLTRLGAVRTVLSTNSELRLDGRPRSEKDPADPGAAVYFTVDRQPRCLACDKYLRLGDNIAALAAHIDALRRISRYGVGTIAQAFAGYLEGLPPVPEHDWHIVLGVRPVASVEEIQRAFEQLARQHHPDVGGSHEAMARLSAARDAALRVRRSA